MRGTIKYLFPLMLTMILMVIRGQNPPVDSLKKSMAKNRPDTTSVLILNALSEKYNSLNSVDSALKYGQLSLNTALSLNFKKGIFLSCSSVGEAYRLKADYKQAHNYFLKALRLGEELSIANPAEGKKRMASSYCYIGLTFSNEGNIEQAMANYDRSMRLYKELDDKKGLATMYGNMGVIYRNQGEYAKALDNYFNALKWMQTSGDKAGIARISGRIGLVYSDQGNYPKALDYYLKALRLDEELADTNGMAVRLGNIGTIYLQLEDYGKALSNYLKVSKLIARNGSQMDIAANLSNIGSAYNYLDSVPQSLEYFTRSLNLSREIGYKQLQAINLTNMGIIYQTRGINFISAGMQTRAKQEYEMSLTNYLEALKISEELGDKKTISANLTSIGSLYTLLEKYRDAATYLFKALAIDKSNEAIDNIKEDYRQLSVLYEETTIPLLDTLGGKPLTMELTRLKSLEYLKRYISIRDMLFSEENKKEVLRKELNFGFEKKAAAAKAEQEKKDAVALASLRKQQIILFLLGIILVIVAIAGFVIFKSLLVAKKQKRIIEKQKQIVEEHQKEVIDSIHYARRIQTALLPTERYINKSLLRMRKD
jgi:tetratricopeptide (TPR) repeat protein